MTARRESLPRRTVAFIAAVPRSLNLRHAASRRLEIHQDFRAGHLAERPAQNPRFRELEGVLQRRFFSLPSM